MSMPNHRFTYADYCLLPEDKRYELVEGDLLMTPAPSVVHQRIHAELFGQLFAFVKANRLGQVLSAPTDVILSDENVVQPDVLYVSAARMSEIESATAGLRSAPDLVVEILSPSSATRDQVLKRKLYSKYGVKEYWIVSPDGRTVEVLTPAEAGLRTWRVFGGDDVVQSPLLPGFALPLDQLFPH